MSEGKDAGFVLTKAVTLVLVKEVVHGPELILLASTMCSKGKADGFFARSAIAEDELDSILILEGEAANNRVGGS